MHSFASDKIHIQTFPGSLRKSEFHLQFLSIFCLHLKRVFQFFATLLFSLFVGHNNHPRHGLEEELNLATGIRFFQ